MIVSCGAKVKRLDTPDGTLNEADRLAKAKFYEEARNQYFRIKTEFPESELQVQADLKIAETYFKEKSYESSAESYRDFIKNYPGHPELPYALYMLGQSYEKQMPGNFERDSRATEKATDAYTRLIIDFPQSQYTAEALAKIDHANDQLARKVFRIARFYEKQDEYEAAARRFAQVMDLYADHPLAERAFARRIKMLQNLNETEQVTKLRERFLEQYPDSQYKNVFKRGDS